MMSRSQTQHDRLVAESIPGALLRYTLQADGREASKFLNSRCELLWETTQEAVTRQPSLLWAMLADDELVAVRASIEQSARALSPWQAE